MQSTNLKREKGIVLNSRHLVAGEFLNNFSVSSFNCNHAWNGRTAWQARQFRVRQQKPVRRREPDSLQRLVVDRLPTVGEEEVFDALQLFLQVVSLGLRLQPQLLLLLDELASLFDLERREVVISNSSQLLNSKILYQVLKCKGLDCVKVVPLIIWWILFYNFTAFCLGETKADRKGLGRDDLSTWWSFPDSSFSLSVTMTLRRWRSISA